MNEENDGEEEVDDNGEVYDTEGDNDEEDEKEERMEEEEGESNVEEDTEVEEMSEEDERESEVARLRSAKSVGSWVAFWEKKERLQEGHRRFPASMAWSRHEVQKEWPQKSDLGHLSPFPYLR